MKRIPGNFAEELGGQSFALQSHTSEGSIITTYSVASHHGRSIMHTL